MDYQVLRLCLAASYALIHYGLSLWEPWRQPRGLSALLPAPASPRLGPYKEYHKLALPSGNRLHHHDSNHHLSWIDQHKSTISMAMAEKLQTVNLLEGNPSIAFMFSKLNCLVVSTPLNNMSLSVGMMTFKIQ